jgi:RNA polymerase sigma-70 factor (ECF subfamily)
MPEIITNLPANAEFSSAGPTAFTTTHWSVVLAAGDTRSPDQAQALEKLCRAYWYPLYAFVRRQGFNAADAQDLTQEFFARLLAGNYLRNVQRSQGKFRSYLLGALKHFLANEWDKAQAAKRGGGQVAFSFEELDAENLYGLVAKPDWAPEEVYDQSWAWALLEQVRTRLRDEYTAGGKVERFELLVQFLPGAANAMKYDEVALRLNLSLEAVWSEVHRLRKRYRELVRLEIAQTVATPAEIEEEVRYLIGVLSHSP